MSNQVDIAALRGRDALESKCQALEIENLTLKLREENEQLRTGLLAAWRAGRNDLAQEIGEKSRSWREADRAFRIASSLPDPSNAELERIAKQERAT